MALVTVWRGACHEEDDRAAIRFPKEEGRESSLRIILLYERPEIERPECFFGERSLPASFGEEGSPRGRQLRGA